MESLHDIHELVKFEDYEEVKQIAQSLVVGSTSQGSAPQSEEVSDGDYLSKLQS
tara:strand:- start:83 stop:244 length:162 start_codon:yes stop_codon:yes gene_type:complete